MDKLYDDKLDEKITQEFYNRKFKQYSKEKDELTETIKRHSTASTGYLNLGINLYELSQRAKEIYLTAKKKDMLDEQRALIRLVFKKLILDEGKLSWEYSRAFKILSEAVSQTNCSKVENLEGLEKETFEHRELPDNSTKKDALCIKRPIWLPSPEIIMKAKMSIINAFLDSVAWEAVKNKWVNIKSLNLTSVSI